MKTNLHKDGIEMQCKELTLIGDCNEVYQNVFTCFRFSVFFCYSLVAAADRFSSFFSVNRIR